MNLMQLASNLRGNIPSQRRADDCRTQEVEARLVITHHERKILRHVLKQNLQRVLGAEILLRSQNVILQNALIHQREVLWVSGTNELQNHLHEFLARQLRAGKGVEDCFAILSVEFFALGNPASVSALEFDPPIRIELS